MESTSEANVGATSQKRLYGRSREISLLRDAVQNCWGRDFARTEAQAAAAAVEPFNVDNVDRRPPVAIRPLLPDAVVHDRKSACNADTAVPYVGLVLVSGPRGVGKRALVEESLSEGNEKGLVLHGRFPPIKEASANLTHVKTTSEDQEVVQNDGNVMLAPGSAARLAVFADALERATLHTDSTTLERMRHVVAQRFAEHSSDREILVKILSCTLVQSLLFSPDPHETASTPQATAKLPTPMIGPVCQATSTLQHRPNEQCAAMARFLFVLSTCVPIVLHLEQVQYADVESLSAIQGLCQTNWEQNSGLVTKGLLIVASYRDDAEARSDFAEFLCAADGMSQGIGRIQLLSLARNDLHSWVQQRDDATLTQESQQSLTDLMYDLSAGNPQHVSYLFCYLRQAESLRCIGADALEDLRQRLPQSLDSLLELVLSQLPSSVRDVVDTAAALGDWGTGTFDYGLIEMVLQRSCAVAVAQLRKCEVLVWEGERIRFYRPELQALVYSMIPESSRAALHLKIGRRVWKNSSLGSDDEVDEDGRKLDLIAHQLWRGMPLVTDREELHVMAKIHCRVGKHAMRASKFQNAVFHFEVAKQVLGIELWGPERYDITLMVFNCLAEALYCTGEFEAMEKTIDAILEKAVIARDKLQAYTTLVFSNGARHRLKEAVNTALLVLDQLGEPLARDPSLHAVVLECLRIKWMMSKRNDRYFLGLPAATDNDKIAAMQMLNFTFLYSFVINPKIAAMAVFRMLRLTMVHGVSPPAGLGFCGYGFLLTSFGYMEEGHRFGRIALSLMDQFDGNGKAWVPRVYFCVYGLINPKCCPLRDSLEPLQFAHQSALTTGDIEGSAIAAGTYVGLSFHSGTPLLSLQSDAMAYCRLLHSLGQTLCLIFIVPLWHVMCRLTESSVLSLNLTGPVTDSDSACELALKEGNKTALSMYFGTLAIQANMFGEYTTTLAMAAKSLESAPELDFHLIFHHGLAALSLARHDARWAARRRKHLSLGVKAVRQLRKLARVCPANIRNKQYLLEAELAALHGRPTKALLLFDKAIMAAREEGFIHEEGMAYERLAHYHCHLGHAPTAAPYFERARHAYSLWGAQALIRRMDSFMEALPKPRHVWPATCRS